MLSFREILLLLLFILISFPKSVSQEKSTALIFDQEIFDFGNIQEKDGKISHVFKFTNAGEKPFIIKKIVTGCSCTGFDYSSKPVFPGKSGFITISYNPYYRPGFFSKEIVIIGNDHPTIHRIWIKGNVTPFQHPVEEDYPYNFGNGLHFNLKVLSFGKMEKDENKQIKLRYANDTDNTLKLKFIISNLTEEGILRFNTPEVLLPKERGVITFNYTLTQKIFDTLELKIFPIVNGLKLKTPLIAKISGNNH